MNANGKNTPTTAATAATASNVAFGPRRRTAAALAAGAIALLALTGCTTTATTPAGASPAVEQSAAASATEAAVAGLSAIDPWIKATDSGMTGMFGTLRNDTGADITVVSASVPGAGMVELHETVVQSDGASVMRPVEGGFLVPAGGEYVLQPGGNHIMLMGITEPFAAGDDVTVTLELADGSTVPVTAVVKEYAGARETYAPEGDGTGEQEHGPDESESPAQP